MSTDLDAAWRNLEWDALASDGPIRDSDVKDAIKHNRPKIEALLSHSDQPATPYARLVADVTIPLAQREQERRERADLLAQVERLRAALLVVRDNWTVDSKAYIERVLNETALAGDTDEH